MNLPYDQSIDMWSLGCIMCAQPAAFSCDTQPHVFVFFAQVGNAQWAASFQWPQRTGANLQDCGGAGHAAQAHDRKRWEKLQSEIALREE